MASGQGYNVIEGKLSGKLCYDLHCLFRFRLPSCRSFYKHYNNIPLFCFHIPKEKPYGWNWQALRAASYPEINNKKETKTNNAILPW